MIAYFLFPIILIIILVVDFKFYESHAEIRKKNNETDPKNNSPL